jgi:electron transfer flavoprotein alpha subunit
MNGCLGATAGAVRNGLAPRQLEIGVLKRSMSPLLFVALGVEEAEDVDAVRAARRLVSVHPDAGASIHTRADLAIACDPGELVREALARMDGEEEGR